MVRDEAQQPMIVAHADMRHIEGTRKQSLGNIYQQQQQSYSTPTANTYNSSSGALDNLMADLMNSMNDDIHLSATNTMPSSQNKSSHCDVCREDFDYRDDVKTVGGKVRFKVLPKYITKSTNNIIHV